MLLNNIAITHQAGVRLKHLHKLTLLQCHPYFYLSSKIVNGIWTTFMKASIDSLLGIHAYMCTDNRIFGNEENLMLIRGKEWRAYSRTNFT
jgi:hypothetical protein